LCLAAAAAALAVRPARAQVADDGIPIAVSPYPRPFVPLAVNGRAATALLDTGSMRGLQISARLREEAGLRANTRAGTTQRYDGGGRDVFAGVADEVVLGSHRAVGELVHVAPGDIERITGQVGTSFDAILGWPFLSRFDVAIDYRAMRLRLDGDAGAGADASAWRLATDPTLRVPVVTGGVAGRELRLLVDTGSPTSRLDVTAGRVPGRAGLHARGTHADRRVPRQGPGAQSGGRSAASASSATVSSRGDASSACGRCPASS
jgi:hypothetical protein